MTSRLHLGQNRLYLSYFMVYYIKINKNDLFLDGDADSGVDETTQGKDPEAAVRKGSR